jgi:hypothetical protein
MIAPVDLLAPAGPVEATLFRDESMTVVITRLQTYINRAYAKIEGKAFPLPDEAATLWALYLAFDAAYILSCALPGNENSMVQILGSEGFHKDQRDGLKNKRDEYQMAYEVLEHSLPQIGTISAPQTRQTSLRYEF